MQRTMDHSPREAIIVVAIDEESLKTYGQFPWERDVFVPFFDHVSRARAVLFDIMFSTDGKDRESDRRFAEALARHDNVILAASPVTETAVSRTLRAKAGELLPVHGVNPPFRRLPNRRTSATSSGMRMKTASPAGCIWPSGRRKALYIPPPISPPSGTAPMRNRSSANPPKRNRSAQAPAGKC